MCQFDNEPRVPQLHTSISISGVGRLLEAERAVVVLDRSVTFAGGILEAFTVEDFHASASILD
jgi:hypothetical protein